MTNKIKNVFGELYARRRLEKSFFGYDPSVLKSGIQKYARRNELEKGLWCLIEMDLFSLVEWDGAALDAYLQTYPEEKCKNAQGQAIKIRSNMINRLVVMMTEEVSISAWWMPLKIFELYQKWVESRDNIASRKFLVDIYLYLTSQKMIRLISDLRSVFQLPALYLKPEQKDDLMKIHNNIKEKYPQVFSDEAKIGNLPWEFDISKYPSKLKPCINGIIYNLEIGSDNVFYWIRKLWDHEQEDKVHKNKYFKIIWELLYCFIDVNNKYEFVRDVICALQKIHTKMTHREKPIYLFHAALLIVRRKEIDWNSKVPLIDTPMADVENLYRDHLTDGRKEMDDYVLDLHTRGAKKTDQRLENFAMEGAYIKNENDKFLNKEYW